MAEKLKLDLVTPYRLVLSEEVDEITAPGLMGEFGILPAHTPLLTTLQIGEFSYRKGNELFHVAVNWGFVEVENDRVTVLVETAEPADEIDLERAKAALGRAEEALKKLSAEEKDFLIMKSALDRALVRIKVAGRESK
ncbi:ATP synthase F1 subcomplex epsilon subunit [Geoalkalibacter ferrihydriticus]|uniref:ATP synthase epsilon chain n=2 Tax=Geoalkalibacter ferrihydriticus TaxID=392333 RepID=A0A0C2HSQ9_9BACT|nr:F0F1 ATP synthase subunit epsilon [Geoalkalibacter ferrihydriticus]KIH77835.1 ATP synthase F0F1 subunit epsilon [Geoalkalibacter ferrihydriticus DSM 17813]SDL81664.1 ATP synthase F1 subcomplex epsilon subunit [Geoalkalibacter ferrihydriticus]